MLTQAFSKEAIGDPNRRIIESDWLEALARFQSDIVRCPHCEAKGILNEIFINNASDTPCDRCGNIYHVKYAIDLGRYKISAIAPNRIYRFQLGACSTADALKPVAFVKTNPKVPDMLGLCNCSGAEMTAVYPNGKVLNVAVGMSAPLFKGAEIEILGKKIRIE